MPAIVKVALVAGLIVAGSMTAHSIVSPAELRIVDQVNDREIDTVLGGNLSQDELNALVASDPHAAFEEAFEHGDELFGTRFNALDGGGANVGGNQRFTRAPRADLRGAGQWFTHTPERATGPNARGCLDCHMQPAEDGAGEANSNAMRDPLRNGRPGELIQRNTPHVFAMAPVQRLAEEMTAELLALRNAACGCGAMVTAASGGSCSRTIRLTAKGVDFGSATVTRAAGQSRCTTTVSATPGRAKAVSDDLVVRPFQWKGSVPFIRDFNRGAMHNELGMQGVELHASDGIDGDGDGVRNELTVGDITALTIYSAGQPRPTTRVELAALGLIPALSAQEKAAIARGSTQFQNAGCATCHVPQITVNDPVFSEPSTMPEYRDALFPGGRDPRSLGVRIESAVTFNFTTDLLDNPVMTPSGQTLGNLERTSDGGAIVRLYGDLRRHDLGASVAEQIDEVGTGRSVFLTENLWGVGSTGPWLHDGRATTLSEAILAHHGEAESSRSRFVRLSAAAKQDLEAFLLNLVLFKAAEE